MDGWYAGGPFSVERKPSSDKLSESTNWLIDLTLFSASIEPSNEIGMRQVCFRSFPVMNFITIRYENRSGSPLLRDSKNSRSYKKLLDSLTVRCILSNLSFLDLR